MTDSNNRMLSTLIALQLSVLGILIVMLFNPPLQSSATNANQDLPESSLEREDPSASPFQSDSEPVSPELKAALREIIRNELAALTASSSAAKDDFTSQPDITLSESKLQEQETAAMVSATIVQQATSAGVWSGTDTEALLPHLGKLSEQQRLLLMDQLYSAINRQEMDIQDFPPL